MSELPSSSIKCLSSKRILSLTIKTWYATHVSRIAALKLKAFCNYLICIIQCRIQFRGGMNVGYCIQNHIWQFCRQILHNWKRVKVVEHQNNINMRSQTLTHKPTKHQLFILASPTVIHIQVVASCKTREDT